MTAVALPASGGGLRRRSPTASALRYGLRSHRWVCAGVAFIGFVVPYAVGASYAKLAGTAAARATFGAQTTALGPQLAYLVPLPLRPDTVAGYLWWKGLAWFTLIFAAWGLAAAAGFVRHEEERGLMETWLASPLGRIRLLLSRTVAFTLAAAVAVVVTGLGTAAGLVAGKAPVSFGVLVEQGVPLLGIALVCFGVGLVAAQVAVTRRGTLALGTAVLLALYALDAMARVNTGLDGWAVVSPFHLVDLTTAVVPGGRFDGAATVALYGIAITLVAVATLGFVRRDLLASLLRRRSVETPTVRTASTNRLLRLPVLRSLWRQRLGLAGWIVGTMVGAGLIVSLAHGTGKMLSSVAGFDRFIHSSGTSDAATAVVGSVWLGIAALIVAAYAIAQISRWASDDDDGWLEMEIAQPLPRWRVVAERCITLAVGAAVMSTLGSLVTAAVAPGQGVHLDAGRLVIATALLTLLALTFGALGALVITRLPRAAVPVLTVIAVAGFYLPLLAPLLSWPSWALDLSLFHLYGTPLTTGVFWTGLWIMCGVVVVGFGGGIVAMRYRDVGR